MGIFMESIPITVSTLCLMTSNHTVYLSLHKWEKLTLYSEKMHAAADFMMYTVAVYCYLVGKANYQNVPLIMWFVPSVKAYSVVWCLKYCINCLMITNECIGSHWIFVKRLVNKPIFTRTLVHWHLCFLDEISCISHAQRLQWHV